MRNIVRRAAVATGAVMMMLLLATGAGTGTAVAATLTAAVPGQPADTATVALAGGSKLCLVTNNRSGQAYTGLYALHAAVDKATDGDTLTMAGTCTGPISIRKNLTLAGSTEAATLDGNDRGRTLTVSEGTVTINTLTITGGGIYGGTGGGGLFVGHRANVTLNDVTITGNTAARDGGGIANAGILSLADTAISGNTAHEYGGGIYNVDILSLADTSIHDNTARYRFGGGIYNSGDLSLANTSIYYNTAVHGGGGIYTLDHVVATASRIFDNRPDNCDGPVDGCHG